jgi:hypothetical protein
MAVLPEVIVVLLRWVYTCNITAYHNAITLQVSDTIQSYDLNFHPVPHGVTVSCERYIRRFPVLLREPELCLCS